MFGFTGVYAYFGVLQDPKFVDTEFAKSLSGSQSLNKEVYFSYFIGMKFYSVQIILAFYVEMKTKEHFKALEISNASKVNRLKSSPSTRA